MGSLRRNAFALLLLAACVVRVPPAAAAGVPLDAATEEQKLRAQQRFVDAKKQFDEKKFEDALKGFEASYGLVASPNSRLMIARTLRALDRVAEAYLAYQAVIGEANQAAKIDEKYGLAADAAAKELDEIRPMIGFIVIQVVGGTDDTDIFVNDEPVERAKWGQKIPVRVGVITVSAKAPGKKEHREKVTVASGSMTHKLDLQRFGAPSPAPPSASVVDENNSESVDLLGLDTRAWAYIAGGVGAAGVVTFGVFGTIARSKYKSLDSDCPNRVCPTDRSEDIDAGRRNQMIANVGLVIGVVGLGTGTALYLMSNDGKKGREEPSTQVGLGPGSVTVQGTF